jgi:hypothetical protein
MTLAGTAVATFAAALVLVGLTGGCSSPTDTRHYDQSRTLAPPPPVTTQPLWVGGAPMGGQ